MDGHRFDELVRAFAQRSNRRSFMTRIAAGIGAGLFARAQIDEVDAAPGPKQPHELKPIRRCKTGDPTCGSGCCKSGQDCLGGRGCAPAGSTPCGEGYCNEGVLCVDGLCGCPAGLTECNGECVDTKEDWRHCGGCDRGCSAPGDASGACCDGKCVPGWNVDRRNCGACGVRCSDGPCCGPDIFSGVCCGAKEECVSGACVDKCPKKQRRCGDGCCPNARDCCNGVCCPNGESCVDGVCCPAAQACDDNCCADNTTCCDGRACCSEGQTCCNGTCCSEGRFCVDGACTSCSPETFECTSGSLITCCADGTTCCNTIRGLECCADGQRCFFADGCSDCPEETRLCGDTCCPDGRICCDHVCCEDGAFCVDGLCSLCPAGEIVCGENCCAGGQECVDGTCRDTLTCPGGVTPLSIRGQQCCPSGGGNSYFCGPFKCDAFLTQSGPGGCDLWCLRPEEGSLCGPGVPGIPTGENNGRACCCTAVGTNGTCVWP